LSFAAILYSLTVFVIQIEAVAFLAILESESALHVMKITLLSKFAIQKKTVGNKNGSIDVYWFSNIHAR